MPRPSPPSTPAAFGAWHWVLPGPRRTQPSQGCGHRLGCLTFHTLKTPEAAIVVLEGSEKVGKGGRVSLRVSFCRHCQTPDQMGPHHRGMPGQRTVAVSFLEKD